MARKRPARFLRVRNLERFQHYKDRSPVWIKLYSSMLEDYSFQQLPDATKFHAISLMLLASRMGNKLPNDAAWLGAKCGANSAINLELLLESKFLEEFIEPQNGHKSKKVQQNGGVFASATFDTPENCASTETETETEKRRTHTDTERDARAREIEQTNVSCVSLGKFSLGDYRRYVEHCQQKGQKIHSPDGLAITLQRTGEADALIEAVLFPERLEEAEAAKYGSPREFTDDICTRCYGSKIEIVEGKGARSCEHCKDERGRRTGKEPKAAMCS